jgi:hypothetical protein
MITPNMSSLLSKNQNPIFAMFPPPVPRALTFCEHCFFETITVALQPNSAWHIHGFSSTA